MISYPRTDGENRGRIYVDKDGIPYAKIGQTKISRDKATYLKYDHAKIITYDYVKRTPEERESLRKDFDSKVRKSYAKHIADTKVDELKKAGLSNNDIERMKNDGKLPQGYQVHHQLSIDDNGDNNFNNLILIRNKPEHTAITASQNHFSKGMKPNESKKVDFIIFEENLVVYPPDNSNPARYTYDDLE